MIDVIPIYKHLKSSKWYNDLFDKIVENGVVRWEEDFQNLAANPSEKQLADLRKFLEKKGSKKYSHQDIWESNHNLMSLFSLLARQWYKQLREKDRKKTIKGWRDKDRKKDKKVMNAKPFNNIKCPKCAKKMEYQWSELHDKGTLKKPDEQVMFFYECPDKCKRKLIFENGIPWISKTNNTCPVCNSNRSTTVTKDNSGKMYFIYECVSCGGRQVEKETD